MDFHSSNKPEMTSVIKCKAGNQISSLSFHADGQYLFSASKRDSRIRVIDSLNTGTEQLSLFCKEKGAHLIEATHHPYSVLVSNNKNNVDYLSVYDNKYLRSFEGHSGAITNVSMSPADDRFLTSSQDGTVRLWSLDQAGCIGKMDLPANNASMGSPYALFDSTGLVFGITAPMSMDRSNSGCHIHLYDSRNFSSGAFAELKVTSTAVQQKAPRKLHNLFIGSSSKVSSSSRNTNTIPMKFNYSGKQMLLSDGSSGATIVLDGFDAKVHYVLVDDYYSNDSSTEACVGAFTIDDKYILVGGDAGSITCFDAMNGEVIQTLNSSHVGRVGHVAMNPRYASMATACTNIALWI